MFSSQEHLKIVLRYNTSSGVPQENDVSWILLRDEPMGVGSDMMTENHLGAHSVFEWTSFEAWNAFLFCISETEWSQMNKGVVQFQLILKNVPKRLSTRFINVNK